ncbi:uncharacterized protein [Venturia canescens]|uniref:uncharacterized protein n=1 Tax=Venturia canescens TaxID=32260 RepID=UPI001C9CFBDC|nr:uncharacterized protein LOC122405606 [Venturia canescens]
MGFSESKSSTIRPDNHNGIYRVRAKDTAVMKKVWRIVEFDLTRYAAVFSAILFRNHPQYIKYFQDDNIPEFVQDARIKKKISAVCTVVSALFIDYSKKRRQRDHLLGYVAMIHKDMQLSSQDLEQFCGWLIMCDPPSMYGRPLEHWILKKRYWEIKTAFWASIEMEMSGMSSFLSMEKDNHNKTKKGVAKHRTNKLSSENATNPWSKPIKHFAIAMTSSKSISAENTHKLTDFQNLSKNFKNTRSHKYSWYDKYKNRKNRETKSVTLMASKPMETIEEDQSRGPSSRKPSKTHVNSTKVQGDFKVQAEAQKTSSDFAIKDRTSVVDAERARKRRRDKRNVVHPATEL